ncbi:MAG: Histidine kinase [Acidobacteria bacterium]|nr:Histidine kinase [Acidobacteriota bacterium]
MSRRKLLLALAFVAATSIGVAPGDALRNERGFPLITLYGQAQFKAGSQTFDVAQDGRGIMYFANLHGVLSFDGAWWRLMPLPNESAAFRVTSNDRGEMAVGGVGELGVVVVSPNGETSYRSLVAKIPANARNFGDVHGIAPAGERSFVFVTDHFIFFWNGSEMRIVADGRRSPLPNRCYRIGSTIWLTGANGLEKLDPTLSRIEPVALAGKQIDVALDGGDGRVIIFTHQDGIFALASAGIVPFASGAATWLSGKTITGGCRLRDGRIAITTRQDGLLIVDANGDPDQLIDHAAGLPDDVLAGAITDHEGSLWLAMHGAIARIGVAAPVTLLDTRSGIKGAVNALKRIDGRLYTGTSHGLFVIDPRAARGISAANIATVVDGVPGGVWQVADDRKGSILAATSDGLFQLRGAAKPSLIDGTAGLVCYNVVIAPDSSHGWLLTRQFIAKINHDANGTWHLGARIPSAPAHARTVVERGGVLWCGTIFNGIARIDTNIPQPRIDYFGSGEMSVAELGGEIVFNNRREIFRIGPSGTPESDPMFSGAHAEPEEVFFHAALDARGGLWMNTHPPRRLERDANGRFSDRGEAIVAVEAISIPLIAPEPDGVVWIGTDIGLYRYEPTPSIPQPRPGIHVSGGNRLEHGFGRLRVEFAPASYLPGLTYQYRLEPHDLAWSQWTTDPFIDFTNLAPGDYTFHLRTRGAGPGVSEEARWTFTVTPPWYRTPWAMLLWLLLAAAIIYLIVRLRTTTLNHQAARLRERIAERTDELRMTVDQLRNAQRQLVDKNELLIEANGRLERLSLLDELTGIANRRYFQRALADDWERARERQQPLALVLIDLDHFKDLNDTHGHQAGDACLRQIGAFLAQQSRRSGDIAIRSGDLVARYGGEEFALLLTDTAGEEARRLAERLRAGIEALAIPYNDDTTLRVTASCGVASMVPTGDETISTLIARADHALYAAKYEGRNRVAMSPDEAAPTSAAWTAAR